MQSIEPEINMYDLFVVDVAKHPEHWRAWREWYKSALNRTCFPPKVTMLFAWPPQTDQQVTAVLLWLQKLQDEVRSEAKSKKLQPPKLAPIPKTARPHPRPQPTPRRIAPSWAHT